MRKQGKPREKDQRNIWISAVFGALLLVLYVLIFFFSAQNGEESGGLSELISRKCVELLNALSGRNWTELFMEGLTEYFEHPIRKLAHFGEYAAMGVLVYGMWYPWRERIGGKRRLFLLTVCWVFVSAGADELHQAFVPDRYNSIWDVLLDTAGGCFGGALCWGATRLWAGRAKKKKGGKIKDARGADRGAPPGI